MARAMLARRRIRGRARRPASAAPEKKKEAERKEQMLHEKERNEEEARKNAARGSLPRNKAMSLSPWLNKEQTSCELEYHSEEDGVSGVSH